MIAQTLRKQGLSFTLQDDSFSITAASEITQQQREFLRTNKAVIISELRAEQAVNKVLSRIVICYSPSGLAYEVEATSSEHAELLRRMNPNRT